jgi:hypothetical protein
MAFILSILRILVAYYLRVARGLLERELVADAGETVG